MKLLPLLAALLAGLFSLPAQAQTGGVTIGAAGAPDASAALEVRTTTQGLLLPRLTSDQRAAIASPAAGLLVFQTDNTPGLYYFDGTLWRNLTTGAAPEPRNLGVVSTLAGSAQGFADGTGAAALFSGPTGVAYDGSGNLYVSEWGNNRIRKVEVATGVVTTLAGSSSSGSADGTGPTAQFNLPTGVACDGLGNVYVTEINNHRIRKIVAATGDVTTLAGSTAGFADGTGPAAQFNQPYGVACDAFGNVFVADYGNNRIRRIVAATGVVTTLAGSATSGTVDAIGPAAQFRLPEGVACDASGNLYVSEWGNNRIRKIVAATGTVTTVAGSSQGFADGPGPGALFYKPTGVACDASGNLYVADFFNYRVRKIVLATGLVTTVAGGTRGFADGPGPSAQFNGLQSVACNPNGEIYVTDRTNQRVRVIK